MLISQRLCRIYNLRDKINDIFIIRNFLAIFHEFLNVIGFVAVKMILYILECLFITERKRSDFIFNASHYRLYHLRDHGKEAWNSPKTLCKIIVV